MDEVINRIFEIISKESITQADFAKRIDVDKATLSHLSSGRNKKPSLEIIMNIVEEFPKYSLEWLLFGKEKVAVSPTEVESKPIVQPNLFNFKETKELTHNVNHTATKNEDLAVENKANNDKKVNKIILLYHDNTFDIFKA